MEITVNIICALFGGAFGWFVAHTFYRDRMQHEEEEDSTNDTAPEGCKAAEGDILIPLAVRISETMKEWRKKKTVFPIDLGQEGAAASCLDLTFLNEYINEPKIGNTPSPIVRSIRNIIKRAEHYNEGFAEAALRARQTATEAFDKVQKQCNKYLFIGLNKIRINQLQCEPDVYLQSYLTNEHNCSKFCSYICGGIMISVNGLKAGKSKFSGKEITLGPENIESLIAIRKKEFEKYGYNAQQIKDELWYVFVLRDIFDKEKDVSRDIRNYVKEAALKEELDSIAALLDEMKTGLEKGFDK